MGATFKSEKVHPQQLYKSTLSLLPTPFSSNQTKKKQRVRGRGKPEQWQTILKQTESSFCVFFMVGRPKDLTNEERNLCVQFLLQSSSNGKPKRGKIKEAATMFGISRFTVSRLWRAAKDQQSNGLAVCIVSKKLGRKREKVMQPNYIVLKGLDVCERGCYRSMVKKMGVSKSTLHRWGQAGLFRVFASFIKPSLTQDNKFLRIRFSLEALELDMVMNTLRYSTMHNIVHIDEKWFFITKGKNR